MTVQLLVIAAATMQREFHVHNPHNVTVTAVHMVQSAHFDAGCECSNNSAKQQSNDMLFSLSFFFSLSLTLSLTPFPLSPACRQNA